MSSPTNPNPKSEKVTAKAPDEKEVFKTLNTNKIYIPVLIGLGVAVYFFLEKVDIPIFLTGWLATLFFSSSIYFFKAFSILYEPLSSVFSLECFSPYFFST